MNILTRCYAPRENINLRNHSVKENAILRTVQQIPVYSECLLLFVYFCTGHFVMALYLTLSTLFIYFC